MTGDERPKGPDSVGAHVKIEKSPVANVLLPSPPIGQYNTEELLQADRRRLLQMVEARGLSLDTLFSNDDTGDGDWSKNNDIRLALLCLDGYQDDEIADILDPMPARGSARTLGWQDIYTRAQKILAPQVLALREENQLVRDWHAVMNPINGNTERYLEAIERKYDLTREEMFHSVETVKMYRAHAKEVKYKGVRPVGLPHKGASKERTADPDIFLRLLYLRSVVGEGDADLQKRASVIAERTLAKDVVTNTFRRILTEKAQRVLGLAPLEISKQSWTSEENKQIANLYIERYFAHERTGESPYVLGSDVATLLGRNKNSVIGHMHTQERILTKRPEYAGLPPFAAFVLEYGDFSIESDKKNIALVIEQLRADKRALAREAHRRRGGRRKKRNETAG